MPKQHPMTRPGSRGSAETYATRPGAQPSAPPEAYGDHGRPCDSNTAIRESERPGATQGSGRDLRDHSGRGPQGAARSDDRLRELVCDRLTDDPDLDAGEIEVEVRDGEAHLSGHVADRAEKRRAEDCAHAVRGIGHVQNDLRVR